jgi:hypothetical protein
MKRLKVSKWLSILIGLTLLIGTLTTVHASPSLVFDADTCPTITETWYGKEVTYRACLDIVYVRKPVDTFYQSMNVYVPEAYYERKCINGYTAKNAPIFMPITVGGYMPGPPATVETESVRYALSKGYVVAAPGARGSTNQKDGLYTGKAPACIVDLKAAVRYLRHNDRIMPGDAEKIIANGTSAGGALSSLLGATGNNWDYLLYLWEIGAAKARDDIFAASCYCPIQNLDNSDTAYEWQFNGIGTELPGYDQDVSDDLKAMFPAYLNSLGLRVYRDRNCIGKGLKHVPGQIKEGTLLTLDEDGEGNFKDYVESFVIASAQRFLDERGEIPEYDWLTIEGSIVTDIDFFEFSAQPAYPGRLPFKMPPAFDSLGLGSFENVLFGTATIDQQHFTQYGFENSAAPEPSLADAKIVKMMNPTYYIGKKNSTIAQYWRIRHGTIDHHTSLAIPVILATMLENNGYDVDFALPWEQDHGGDYDLFSLFAWIEEICHPCKWGHYDKWGYHSSWKH